MGKYEWHIARKGETPKVIRHYRHLTFMYKFVARNPAIFKNKTLTVYDHGKEVADVTWDEVKEAVDNVVSEKPARGQLFKKREAKLRQEKQRKIDLLKLIKDDEE